MSLVKILEKMKWKTAAWKTLPKSEKKKQRKSFLKKNKDSKDFGGKKGNKYKIITWYEGKHDENDVLDI